MNLTKENFKLAIKMLKTVEINEDEFRMIMHPYAHFRHIVAPELCDKAYILNKGKDIFDKRTKGWKMIRETFYKTYPK